MRPTDLTDKQIEEAFATAGDDIGLDITADEVVWTADTIDDFRAARNGYAEPGRILDITPTSLCVAKVQPHRGDRRRDLVVVDFGTVRGAIAI
jgi:hypothetical protein